MEFSFGKEKELREIHKRFKILFIPDCNLGAYVAAQIPEKEFKLVSGGCPIHACVNADDVKKAKALHPEYEIDHARRSLQLRSRKGRRGDRSRQRNHHKGEKMY